jgi:hypothetical protein
LGDLGEKADPLVTLFGPGVGFGDCALVVGVAVGISKVPLLFLAGTAADKPSSALLASPSGIGFSAAVLDVLVTPRPSD